MNKTEQKQRQEFFDSIVNYPYIREDGRLILEPFCVFLSHCFGFDGILELSPYPRDVYNLLIKTIRERFDNNEVKRYVQHQRILDWRPELYKIYPEKTMTCIHASALLVVLPEWIYDIGHSLMRIPEPENPGKYFAWVKEEWLAVYTFINGFHNAFYSFQKKLDRESISKSGFSSFEALHLARSKGIDFDNAVDLLRARHDSYQTALAQIEKALQDEYFLEAIALEECLISNCLFNFLDNKEIKLTNPSFHTLLKKITENQAAAIDFPHQLFSKIDKWRESRNTAIHGFISSRADGLNQSRADFHELTRVTAIDGAAFCNSVVSWYELECVNFIPHEFPRQSGSAFH